MDNEKIERERFNKLRLGAVTALQHASVLLLQAETGNYIEKGEEYDELLKLIRALSVGLEEGVCV